MAQDTSPERIHKPRMSHGNRPSLVFPGSRDTALLHTEFASCASERLVTEGFVPLENFAY